MISTQQLNKFVRDLDKAAKSTPKAFKRFQRRVGDRYFDCLKTHAPPDDEGRLRASFERKTTEFGKEWVETYKKDTIEVGTAVYYASMVNDGHIVGKRIDNKGHRKIDAAERKAQAGKHKRQWVEGRFFREAAEQDMDRDMPALAEEFTDDALREVMG